MIYPGRRRPTSWNALPHRFEAGTLNVGGAVALAAAVSYLTGIGMDVVRAHERTLTALDHGAAEHDSWRPCPMAAGAADRSGVVSFTVDGVHAHDLATILDEEQVCIRAGHHSRLLLRRLGVPATARASFFVYNDASDVDARSSPESGARARGLHPRVTPASGHATVTSHHA